MIAPPLKRVDFTLYGSFAKTYHGHGTDRALLGGIMGFSADDTRIRDSFAIATDRGLGYSFTPNEVETDIHPNTVDIRMENAAGPARTVLLHHDEGVVLAGKVHLHAVDPHDAHLAAAQRFTAHGHYLTERERGTRLTPSWSRMSACPRVWISCRWQTRTSTM